MLTHGLRRPPPRASLRPSAMASTMPFSSPRLLAAFHSVYTLCSRPALILNAAAAAANACVLPPRGMASNRFSAAPTSATRCRSFMPSIIS